MASLSFQGVAKRYGNNAPVVSDLDLDVRDGEFMVLVGPLGLRQEHARCACWPGWRRSAPAASSSATAR